LRAHASGTGDSSLAPRSAGMAGNSVAFSAPNCVTSNGLSSNSSVLVAGMVSGCCHGISNSVIA
jgi:hypothetical protein